jgi:lipopolysaccharide/colanic/teichoic acid biosynthesis glycosyltransferase
MMVNLGESRNWVWLVSAGEEARVLAALEERPAPSELVVSAVVSQTADQLVVEQELVEIKRLLHEASVLVVTSTDDATGSAQVAEVVCEAHLRGLEVKTVEAALLELDPSVPAHAPALIHRVAACGVHQGPVLRFYSGLKDALEPVLALLLLLALSPLVALVALLVKLTSPGPVFYRQTRLGRNRQLFDIIKFRSMRVDAEKNGPMWAAASKTDSRLTPIGGLLRATHLDEIPQIWNVVRGELSFVGPRPERPVFCQEIEEKYPLFRLRTLVKPGITGWAQIRAGYANTIDDSKRKLEFDLFYILKHSPVLDARIVLGTVLVLFNGGSEGRKRERLVSARSKVARHRATLPGLARRTGSTAAADEQSAVARVEFS